MRTIPRDHLSSAGRSVYRSPVARYRHILAALIALTGALLGGDHAAAQTSISGPIYDGNGGPLLSGVVYRAVGDLSVPAGQTLTVQAGAIVKFNSGLLLDVSGTLDVNGTEVGKVHFTSVKDDSVGGDTNGDGPSSGFRSDWKALRFLAGSSASSMEWAMVRYAGAVGYPVIEITDSDVRLDHCTVEEGGHSGIDLGGSTARPAITNCVIDNHTRYAVTGVSVDAVPGFAHNTSQGCGWGSFVRVSSASMTADVRIEASACMSGAVVIATPLDIPPGRTLTLERDVVLKFNDGMSMTVRGDLVTRGRAEHPVVLTDLRDDSYGGDTNGDGPSTGFRNYWQGLQFEPTAGGSSLRSTIIRYTGSAGHSGIHLNGASIRMVSCVVEESGMHALDLLGVASSPLIEHCVFRNCTRYAVTNVPIHSMPGFRHNDAYGCPWGNSVRVTQPSPTADLTLRPRNEVGGAILFLSPATVPAGVTLTVAEGTTVKMYASAGFTVLGTLDLLGTAREPVVITSYRDDSHGGDGNGDGVSQGYQGDWAGIHFDPAAESGLVENVLLRYASYAGWRPLRIDSPDVAARSVRVEHGEYGIEASALSGNAENWQVLWSRRDGIRLTGGSFDLVHASSVANSWTGVVKTGGYSGIARNCISWGNGTGYSGFGAGELLHCDGSPSHDGSNGNIDQDPLFVDAANGDLRLQAASPCLDTGDFDSAVPLVTDIDDQSRILDPFLTGTMLPDMGAHEYHDWSMSVEGAAIAGGRLVFQVDGPPGDSLYLFGLLDGSVVDAPFGIIGAGNVSLTLLATVPVGSPYRVDIPFAPGVVGTRIGVQTRTYPSGNLTVGNITNLYRDTIREPQGTPFTRR